MGFHKDAWILPTKFILVKKGSYDKKGLCTETIIVTWSACRKNPYMLLDFYNTSPQGIVTENFHVTLFTSSLLQL
ncbi:unnamed protein product [Allacma fusca]|uniref:Uncharacterized protein n=1 Tax=Allacma fusca TaxID=39272 RepID=A0A8J2P9I8_9HEXA|nr:unnamed protein product [Allacma fusca]